MAYTKASLKRIRAIIREGKLIVARIERKQTSKLINHGTRNGHVLMSFVDYCTAHPSERFWQALLNWSGLNYITHTAFPAAMVNEHANYQGKRCEDTYYWEGRNS